MPTYHVISNGIADGQDADTVRRQLAALFKTTEDQVADLLSQTKILKKLNTANSAQRYQAAFADVGLACYVEKIDTEQSFEIAEHHASDGLDSSWEEVVICPDCGFHQPKLQVCQNCGRQLHKLEELGQLDAEWKKLVACQHCDFMQPAAKICRNCGEAL